jgi:hypothetical protein
VADSTVAEALAAVVASTEVAGAAVSTAVEVVEAAIAKLN